MKKKILHVVAKMLGVHIKIDGEPFGVACHALTHTPVFNGRPYTEGDPFKVSEGGDFAP